MTAEAARAAVAAEAAAAAHVQNKSIDQELVATHPGTDLMSASKYLKHFCNTEHPAEGKSQKVGLPRVRTPNCDDAIE